MGNKYHGGAGGEMVTGERKLVSIDVAEKMFRELPPEEAVRKLRALPKRQKAPPPPEGGISVRDSERKYGISRSNVSRLASKGILKIVSRTKNWLYIDEPSLIKYINTQDKDRDNGHRSKAE